MISTFLFFSVSFLDLLCHLQRNTCFQECTCHRTAYHRLLLFYASGIFIIVMVMVRYHWGRPFDIVKGELSVGFSHLKEEARALRKGIRHVAGERMAQCDPGHVPPVFPNGWIPLIESKGVAPGQSVSVSALGQRFCVFRGECGQAYVLDAYCPHLGADMSAGGKVAGECIECPFHGWQFSGQDGSCQKIPYSCKVPDVARAKKWSSCEVNAFIFVWHHAEGEEPTWDMPSIDPVCTGQWKFRGKTAHETEHLIRAFAHAPQRSMVTYTEMGTVGLVPHGLLCH
ncbi:cholesterol 7-desaturase [Trichonephila clavipes]|nr:cholesterol 7-desaturase [Trichonephila clavipes]